MNNRKFDTVRTPLLILIGVAVVFFAVLAVVGQYSSSLGARHGGKTIGRPPEPPGACYALFDGCVMKQRRECVSGLPPYQSWIPGSCVSGAQVQIGSASRVCVDDSFKEMLLSEARDDLASEQKRACGNKLVIPINNSRCEYGREIEALSASAARRGICHALCIQVFQCISPEDIADTTPTPSPPV